MSAPPSRKTVAHLIHIQIPKNKKIKFKKASVLLLFSSKNKSGNKHKALLAGFSCNQHDFTASEDQNLTNLWLLLGWSFDVQHNGHIKVKHNSTNHK